MTLQEMIREVWEMISEPSDLDPYIGGNIDLASTGAQRIRDAINNAQRVVASWKFPAGPRLRFRELEDKINFTSEVLTGTLDAGSVSPYTTVTFTGTTAASGYYDDWVLTVGGSSVRVTSSILTAPTTQTLYLAPGFTFDPSSTAFTLARQSYRLTVAGDEGIAYANSLLEIGQLFDITESSELDIEDTKLKPVETVTGTPGTFIKISKGFTFDVAPDAEHSYQLFVTRYPLDLTALTDECELPEAFHEAVILRAIWWGYRRYQENADAYSVKRDLDDLLARLRTSYDYESETHNAYWKVRSR